MDIKTLNEKLEQFFEEAAMVASNHLTFEDFYNYCLKNPKLKQKLYFSYLNDTIRIPSDTINHAWKKHKTNKIDSWIYVESGGQLTGKPSASLEDEDIFNIRRVRPPYSNNIITYIKQKIKY